MHEVLTCEEWQVTQAYWDRMEDLSNQTKNILDQLKAINSKNISRGRKQEVWEKTIESMKTTTKFLSAIANPKLINLR